MKYSLSVSVLYEEEKLRLEPLLVRYDDEKKKKKKRVERRAESFYARTRVYL